MHFQQQHDEWGMRQHCENVTEYRVSYVKYVH